jgi:adenylylsulfate kinase-like enzyme
MLKRNRIDKNRGFLFFIEGFAGSGKSSIGIKSYKKINVLFGPTIIIHGNQLRDILNAYGYSKIEKKKITYKTRKFIKLIIDQNINVIYTVLCLNYNTKSLYKEKIKNLVEILIDADVKKIIAKKMKKEIYKLKKHVVGAHVKPEFPKNPDIVIKNNFDKSVKSLSNELILKLKRFKNQNKIKKTLNLISKI